MRKSFIAYTAIFMLMAAPAVAGNLTFNNGKTSWISTQCKKPAPPASVLAAEPETAGNDMNALIDKHNVYVNEAQNYMNCISSEAEHDQNMVNQEIMAGAKNAITAMQTEINRFSSPLRGRQQ